VLLVVVLLVALLAATVTGYLQVNAEEIQLMQNHIHGAEALAIAEAGLNDALAAVRRDAAWDDGFADKPIPGGTYTVSMDGSTIQSTGTSLGGYSATMTAHVVISPEGPPHAIGIENLRINE
jgi:hypothetical protein